MRSQTPTVTAVILAAGQSQRMGTRNKLLLPIDGVPMVRRVVETVLQSRIASVSVVTGFQAEAVRAALEGLRLRFVHNASYERGMGSSIAAGAAACPPDSEGVLVCLGDMPYVGVEVIDSLLDAYCAAQAECVWAPFYGGRRGNPVLLARGWLPRLVSLEADRGVGALLDAAGDWLHRVEVADCGVLRDVDTEHDL